ncbi:VOC family protein [Indioceanicola profundi]|uniref:VOC family protein n=1 Tax=Indioceanicola profundi TaxID=2220096 RepID=UPI000E6AB2E1|nr:VOC family protein [Indioceanicola profundi]
MKLKYTIHYVKNVKETLAFYGSAFGIPTQFLHESETYGELNTGETTLSFSSLQLMRDLGKNPSSPDPQRPCFEIAFQTEDVAAAYARAVEAGAVPVQSPERMPWGQTVAYVSDLNGFLVEICTAVET